MQRPGIPVAFAIVLISIPAIAHADEPPCAAEAAAVRAAGRDPSLVPPEGPPEALEHFGAGNRAFGVLEYDKAAEEYTAAGLASDAPVIIYNLAQALRLGRQYERAIRQYQIFLNRGNPGAALRDLIDCHVRTMRAELDGAASTAPPVGPASTVVDVDQPPPSKFTTRRKVALAVAAGSLVAVGAGIAFGLRSNSYEDDAAELCPTGVCVTPAEADRANDLVDKAESNATYANIAFGVGAAAAVGAVVLWLTGAPDAEHATALISPRVGSDAAYVDLRLRF